MVREDVVQDDPEHLDAQLNLNILCTDRKETGAPAWSGKPLPSTTLQRQLVVKSSRPDVYARLSEHPKYSNVHVS